MNQRTLLLSSNIECVIEKMLSVFQAPPHDLKILCIPTAANVELKTDWLKEEKQCLQKAGFKLTDFDITGQAPGAVATELARANIVYVTGGNTFYLLEQMKKCKFADAVAAFLDRGGIYMGSSAGAAVTGPDIGLIASLHDPTKADLIDYKGLGLVNFRLLPHLDHADYGPKIHKLLDKGFANEGVVVGLREDQVALVRGNFVEIF